MTTKPKSAEERICDLLSDPGEWQIFNSGSKFGYEIGKQESETQIAELVEALRKIEDHHRFSDDWVDIARDALRKYEESKK